MIQESLHEPRKTIDEQISSYCLLVPYRSEPFYSEYSVVYCDWDVMDEGLRKIESSLSTRLFDQDVITMHD